MVLRAVDTVINTWLLARDELISSLSLSLALSYQLEQQIGSIRLAC